MILNVLANNYSDIVACAIAFIGLVVFSAAMRLFNKNKKPEDGN